MGPCGDEDLGNGQQYLDPVLHYSTHYNQH